tara:strand:+ start:105 stop:866 length:762 start_codon:yes stop_codon:yes gene_type:complete
MNTNTVWISTAPRTGSMWLYNVTREIYKFLKFDVYPKEIPQGDLDVAGVYDKYAISDNNKINKYVLKIHKILPANIKKSKILTTIRDPRDVCLSFKEFMKTDFDTALNATKTMIKYSDTYKNFDSNYVKFIKYEDIENKTNEVILNIAKFVDANIDLNIAKIISEKFKKDNVKNLIKKNDNDLDFKIKNKKEISKSEIVYFSKTNYRSYDIKTGFQTGHVSERISGEWKNKLNINEIETINKEFKNFIIENNY